MSIVEKLLGLLADASNTTVAAAVVAVVLQIAKPLGFNLDGVAMASILAGVGLVAKFVEAKIIPLFAPKVAARALRKKQLARGL